MLLQFGIEQKSILDIAITFIEHLNNDYFIYKFSNILWADLVIYIPATYIRFAITYLKFPSLQRGKMFLGSKSAEGDAIQLAKNQKVNDLERDGPC